MEDLESIKKILARDSRLIMLPARGKAVFVGDTHGDFDATETVFRLYFKPGYTLVFLGDYVDRGKNSEKKYRIFTQKEGRSTKTSFSFNGQS